jgi:hypothetical protein
VVGDDGGDGAGVLDVLDFVDKLAGAAVHQRDLARHGVGDRLAGVGGHADAVVDEHNFARHAGQIEL